MTWAVFTLSPLMNATAVAVAPGREVRWATVLPAKV